MINAQDFLKKFYPDEKKKLGPPGVAISIINGDEITFAERGYRSVDDKRPVTRDDKWHLGSCGKSMTACLIFQLADEHLLDVRSTIGDIFSKQKIRESLRSVTILQLLSHTAGITNTTPVAFLSLLKRHDISGYAGRKKLCDYFFNNETEWSNDNRFMYSNWGYVIVGHIIDVIAGEFEKILAERIFKKLSMRHAGFGAPISTSTKCEPKGHYCQENILEIIDPHGIADNHPCLSSAGRMHCSMEDWVKYIQYIFARQEKNSRSDDHFFLSPPHSNYIYGGFLRETIREVTRLFHDGSNSFWFSSVSVYPRERTALLVATNWGGRDQACFVNNELQMAFKNHITSLDHISRR